MRLLIEHVDRFRKVLGFAELNAVPGVAQLGDRDRENDYSIYVLVEKTEGKAALRVNSSQPGDGMEAYQLVHM